MNSNKYSNLLQKYYDGLTSVAEERWLTDNAHLQQEQLPLTPLIKEEPVMDWSFDDLKERAAAAEKETITLIRIVKWWKYAAAAIFVVSISTWFYFNNDDRIEEAAVVTVPAVAAPVSAADNNNPSKNDVAVNDSNQQKNILKDKAIANRSPLKTKRKSVPVKNPPLAQKNDDFFVIVDGRRITDENEALTILQQSLVSLSADIKQTMNSINHSPKIDFKLK